MVAAGLASTLVGVVQVFAPEWADGNVIAISAIEGRATGNLRQPNHLSSLLLWTMIAAVWLGERRAMPRGLAAGVFVSSVLGLVLSASRTGVVGVALLALWGAVEAVPHVAARLRPGAPGGRHRLGIVACVLLLAAPLLYLLCWEAVTAWSHATHQVFGGEARFRTEGDISSSRFAIWSDTLAMIAREPWLGVGFGEFNFAWSLTPFPHRPVQFFDHTHNMALQFAVELGVPLALLVLSLLAWALWRAFVAARTTPGADGTMLRAAFMMVLMMVLHSQLEYPLWYAYFLLPTAFAFGLCLGAWPVTAPAAGAPRGPARGVLIVASSLMALGGAASVFDYGRVSAIFSEDEGAPLAQRIAEGERSVLFAHHAHYAAATTAERPSEVMPSFGIAAHYLLDTRLMMAWAIALDEAGDVERARHVAQRLREFRNDDSKPFFAPCDEPVTPGIERPFQCAAPTKPFDYRDFR